MIELIKSYQYDNKYDYIKSFSSLAEQTNYFNNLPKIVISDDNYVKVNNQSFKVPYNYDYLVNEGVNYISFNNGYKDIYAFITEKKYISSDVTLLEFEVDVIQTYHFDFNFKKSFVERKVCNIDEICDYDEGISFGEHNIVAETVAHTKESYYFAMFSGFREEYPIKDRDDKVTNIVDITYNISRPFTSIDGVKYPLSFVPLGGWNSTVMSTYLMDAPNLMGIIVLPKCNYDEIGIEIPVLTKDESGNFVSKTIPITVSTNITSQDITGGSMSVAKSNVTDFYPYTYYVLTDNESNPLIMQPQHCQNSITIKGKTALSHTPVERYYPSYYKGDTSGTIYNITTSSVATLPCGQNNGMAQYSANASQISHGTTMAMVNVLSGVGMTAVSGLTGNVPGLIGGVSSVASGISNVMDNMKRMEDMELTPSSIKTYGTPSTRYAFDTNKVKLLKYTISDKHKQRINNFISRYGNKYNNYYTINHKTYKGYIKMISPDIDSKIDNININKIINIFERGVYIE